MSKKLKVSAWIGLFVATLILLLVGNPLTNSRSPGLGSDNRNRSVDHESLNPQDYPPSKSPRAIKKSRLAVTSLLEPSPNFPDRAEHTVEEMKDFCIPELKLENTNLSQALTELLQQYHDICARTNHTPLSFPISIEEDPGKTFALDLTNISFTTALRIIAARAGVALDKEGTALSFASLDSVAETPKNLYTTTLSVPPNFWEGLERDFSSTDNLNPSVLSLLKEMGIIRSRNGETIAHFIPATGSLILRGSLADKERLQSFNEEFIVRPPTQTKIQTKIIESSELLDLDDTRSVSAAELDVLMRTASQTRGVDVMTAPSVVSRPGEDAPVEIIREHSSPEDWSGVRIGNTTAGYGFGLSMQTQVEIRPDPTKELDAPLEASIAMVDIIPDGHTLIRHVEATNGAHLYYFVTQTLIDATGRPIAARTP